MSSIGRIILKEKRQYFIDMVKAPLMKVAIKLCMEYPEPTKKNTLHNNTHILIGIRDKFFEYENNAGRKPLFEAAWRIFIDEFEHDMYYRHRFEWFIDMIKRSSWEPRIPTRPSRDMFWSEPLERGK